MTSAFAEVFGDTLYYKWWQDLPLETKNLTGRNVIVTGANSGVGFEAAYLFYHMDPAHLVLTVRTKEKGEELKKYFQSKKNWSGKTKVEVWELELESFESVKQFAKRCNEELERLDILMGNAALGMAPWSTTADGWETHLQVNVLSTYLLAALLAPLIRKTTKLPNPKPSVTLKPHIAFATTDFHPFAKFPQRNASTILAALNDKANYDAADQYTITKLLVLMLARHLASSSFWASNGCSKDDVIVCSVNPGFCRSNLQRNMPAAIRWILFSMLAKHPLKGATNYCWACVSDDIPAGAYISMCRVANVFGLANTEEGLKVEERVWEEMASLMTKLAPETEPVWKVSK